MTKNLRPTILPGIGQKWTGVEADGGVGHSTFSSKSPELTNINYYYDYCVTFGRT